MKYVFGEFELNPATRELSRDGTPVPLRPRSLECLVYLIEHRDRAVGRDLDLLGAGGQGVPHKALVIVVILDVQNVDGVRHTSDP